MARKIFYIYFRDLNEDAQRRYLEFRGIKKPEDDNLDVFPICVIEKE